MSSRVANVGGYIRQNMQGRLNASYQQHLVQIEREMDLIKADVKEITVDDY